MFKPHPQLLAAIRRAPRHLQVPLLTTALIESGGRLNAVGDQGQSHGPYQEYTQGRGAGLSFAQRRDPFGSTKRAAREFQTFYGRGARGADLAYRAQRPADRANYISKYNQYVDDAQRLLGAPAGQPAALPDYAGVQQGLAPVAPTINAKKLYSLLQQQSARALAGQMPTPQFGQQLQSMAANYADQAAALQSVGYASVDPPGDLIPAAGFTPGGYTAGGGPHAGTHTLGNWQSDNAYDLMGRAGQPVHFPVGGRVLKISPPGRGPRFAGHGVTLQTPRGRVFVKHIDANPRLSVGQQLQPGAFLGRLTASTAGGPHMHLGAQQRGFLDWLNRQYLGR